MLKSLHPLNVYNQIYARYLEMMEFRHQGFVDVTSYEAGLNLFLMSFFISKEASDRYSIELRVR